MENPDPLFQKPGYFQSPTHSRQIECGSMWLNVEKLSRLAQTMQTDWFLLSEVFQAICNDGTNLRWPFCNKCKQQTASFCVTSSDPPGLGNQCNLYAFPPVAILGKVMKKLQDYPCRRVILIAPGWHNIPWFLMSSQIPLGLPNLLIQ